MSFQATVLQVFVASPGDLPEERAKVFELINLWNRDHAAREHVLFVPVAWEWAVARQGGGGQHQINIQQVKNCDLVIAMFFSKLGRPTKGFESGTAEEIAVANSLNIPIGTLICDKNAPRGTYHGAEFDRLSKYLEKIQKWGLTQNFQDENTLRESVNHILWAARDERRSTTATTSEIATSNRIVYNGPIGWLPLDIKYSESANPQKEGSVKKSSPSRAKQTLEAVASAYQMMEQATEAAKIARIQQNETIFDNFVNHTWPNILERVLTQRRTTHTLLKEATVWAIENNTLLLHLPSMGLVQRIEEPVNQDILISSLEKVTGEVWDVVASTEPKTTIGPT